MIIDNLYLIGKMFKNISLDSVRSGRTCPTNLGVRSCPVRKLICPNNVKHKLIPCRRSGLTTVMVGFVVHKNTDNILAKAWLL